MDKVRCRIGDYVEITDEYGMSVEGIVVGHEFSGDCVIHNVLVYEECPYIHSIAVDGSETLETKKIEGLMLEAE